MKPPLPSPPALLPLLVGSLLLSGCVVGGGVAIPAEGHAPGVAATVGTGFYPEANEVGFAAGLGVLSLPLTDDVSEDLSGWGPRANVMYGITGRDTRLYLTGGAHLPILEASGEDLGMGFMAEGGLGLYQQVTQKRSFALFAEAGYSYLMYQPADESTVAEHALPYARFGLQLDVFDLWSH